MVTPNAGQDHHVVGDDPGEVELPVLAPGEEADAHVPELLIDVGVVDDLADQEEPAVGELDPGLVGVVHRPVHPVAEAELPGQPEGQRTDGEPVLVGPERLHHRAVVVGGELPLDLGLEAEAPPEVGALHGLNLTPDLLVGGLGRPVGLVELIEGLVGLVGRRRRRVRRSSGAAGVTVSPLNDPVTVSLLPSVAERR